MVSNVTKKIIVRARGRTEPEGPKQVSGMVFAQVHPFFHEEVRTIYLKCRSQEPGPSLSGPSTLPTQPIPSASQACVCVDLTTLEQSYPVIRHKLFATTNLFRITSCMTVYLKAPNLGYQIEMSASHKNKSISQI